MASPIASTSSSSSTQLPPSHPLPLSPDSNSAGPDDPRKRKRITLACERCRRRKGRCDGAKPSCSNCVTARVECHPPDHELDGRKKKNRRTSSRTPAPSGGEGGGGGADDQDHDQDQEQQDNPHQSFSFAGTIFERPADLYSMNPDDAKLPAGVAQGGTPQDQQDLLELFAGFSQGMGTPSTTTQTVPPLQQQPPLPPPPPPPPSSSSSSLPQPQQLHVQFEEPLVSDDRRPPSREPALFLQYYRPFGPTAIQPGLEKICIATRAAPTFSRAASPDLLTSSSPASSSLPSGGAGDLSSTLDFVFGGQHYPTDHTSFPGPFLPFGQANSPASVVRIFDDESDIPRPEVLDHLYPLFLERMGCYFPFLSLESLNALDCDDPETRVTAPLLINSVCAVASRFSDSPLITGKALNRLPATYGVPFCDRAKQILVPLLGVPSSNTVAALLLLAYYEFGLNSEGALWMFSGMALRMAQDLGLHQDIHEHRSEVGPKERARDNLLFWSCVLLDRTLALGVGRPVTIKETEINAPLPTDADIALVASPSGTTPESITSPTPSPFPHVVQFMLLYGRICEIVNLPRAAWRPSSDTSHPPSRADTDDPGASRPTLESTGGLNDSALALCAIEDSITQAYNSLPPEMIFTSSNFQRQSTLGSAPTFLHLHLWYNCILILLYRPPLLYPRSNSSNLSLADRLAVVNNSCLTIGQALSCADIVDEYSYLASPFVNQCFFVAASAWIQDYRIRTGRNVLANTTSDKTGGERVTPGPAPHNASATILAQVALKNFQLCRSALDKQARYWLGVGWIAALVDKHGMKKTRMSLKAATEGVETFVSGPEMAIFRRLVQRFTPNRESVPSPELNDEAMNALFSVLSQENFTSTGGVGVLGGAAPMINLTPDDFALAYTFASFPEN
ncbi:hypothetical protein T439DRAFT_322417 [Meredithblackwellia eburnea MCA 4105]